MAEIQADRNEDITKEQQREVLYSAFMLLQEKWILFIINSLLEGPLGFNELSRRAYGINTTTLTQRLNLLEQQGLVTRTVQSMMPPRTIYELTDAGRGLQQVVCAISHWCDQYPLAVRGCHTHTKDR
ncbi:MAG TPA: helix-turn-helix domain-containing protein [Ktedonobacteraceae bacterium]|nr:helix-turn-helix domain-containing protein [Ktedonobacteraceae bacterium]